MEGMVSPVLAMSTIRAGEVRKYSASAPQNLYQTTETLGP